MPAPTLRFDQEPTKPRLSMETTESSDQDPTTTDHRRAMPLWLALGVGAIAVVALVAVIMSGSDDAADPNAVASTDLASFVFINEDGSDGTLADFQGEPVVLNFFASWCAPCRAELPDFVAVNDQAGGAVQFVGVNADLDQDTWLAFVDEFELTYPTVYQPNLEIHEHLGLLGHPATVLLDENGEVVHTFTGVLTEESLKDLIAEHLAVEI